MFYAFRRFNIFDEFHKMAERLRDVFESLHENALDIMSYYHGL